MVPLHVLKEMLGSVWCCPNVASPQRSNFPDQWPVPGHGGRFSSEATWDMTFALVRSVMIGGGRQDLSPPLIYGSVRLVCTERGLGRRRGGPRPFNLSDTGEGVSFPGAGAFQGLPEMRELLPGASCPAKGGRLCAPGRRAAQGWCPNQVSRVCTPGLGLPPPPASLPVSTLKAETRNVSPLLQVRRRGGQGEVLPVAVALLALRRPDHRATGAPCPQLRPPASEKGPLGGGLPWAGEGLAHRATNDLQPSRASPPTLLA